MLSPDALVVSPHVQIVPTPTAVIPEVHSLQPLSSIAELQSGSGEDSEEEDDEAERRARLQKISRGSAGETVIKSGYLWKKGERRKVRKFKYTPSTSDQHLTRCWFLVDVEEAVVCAAACAFGLLQVFGGI